jgi:transcriptional regulator with XRE-family HTH domain
MDQVSDWAQQWAVTTGRCVRRWRTMRKLSAQKLADRCAALGLPGLTRTVITKLENGRKESVSTAELMVLAKALDVPPAMLMFPFGEQRMVEITPGEFVSPMEALYWVGGQDPEAPDRAAEKGSALDLFMIHHLIVDAMLGQRRLWQQSTPRVPKPYEVPIGVVELTEDRLLEMQGLPPLPEEIRLAKEFQYNATLLRTTRGTLRERGFEPPPLPPELAKVEDEAQEDPDGSR